MGTERQELWSSEKRSPYEGPMATRLGQLLLRTGSRFIPAAPKPGTEGVFPLTLAPGSSEANGAQI